MHVLETMKAFWDAKVIVPEIWTMTEPDITGSWESGRHAYHWWWDVLRFAYTDPTKSTIAKDLSILNGMPGKKGSQRTLGALTP